MTSWNVSAVCRDRISKELDKVQQHSELLINFNYHGLLEIPAELTENDYCRNKLHKLYLKGNCITSAPTDISLLKSLSVLHLQANRLTVLSDVVAKLPLLVQLNMSWNKITAMSGLLGKTKALKHLDVSFNKITAIPDEVWTAPSLQTLNVAGNLITELSPEVIRAKILNKLIFDSNQLSTVPSQLWMLENLQQASFCGNQLKCLPGIVTDSRQMKLKKVYFDGNPDLHMIPESLLAVSDLGLYDCSVRVKAEEMEEVVSVHTCCSPVPSLLELAARDLHVFLRGSTQQSETVDSWLPKQMCEMLQLPLSLVKWMVPMGTCSRKCCNNVYYEHCYANRVSLALYNQRLEGTLKGSKAEPSDLAICVSFCSYFCQQQFLCNN